MFGIVKFFFLSFLDKASVVSLCTTTSLTNRHLEIMSFSAKILPVQDRLTSYWLEVEMSVGKDLSTRYYTCGISK